MHAVVAPVTLACISFTHKGAGTLARMRSSRRGDPPRSARGASGLSRPRVRWPRSLAGQLFAVQAVLVGVVVAGCLVFAYVGAGRQAREMARRQTTGVATAVADAPAVARAVRSADPTAELQPYTERLRRDAGVDFIVVMDTAGKRWTHPEPSAIGHTYLGRTTPALAGQTFTETNLGRLGQSVRVITPVRDQEHSGRIVALVSCGITVETISDGLRREAMTLAAVAAGALALGGLGTYLVNARLRRHTHGMNAAELSRLHDYHEAALHAVREGLLMLDGQRRVALVNDAARELLGLREEPVGRPVDALGLPDGLTATLLSPAPHTDELHLTHDRVLVVNTSPVSGGERRGTVVTLRDHTELQALSGELDSVRGVTRALRSQAHEAANRLHTVVSLVELGRTEQAVEFATAELELAQALTDQVVGAVAEPVLAALLLGKAAQANEHGVELVLTPDSRIDDGVLPAALPPRDLVTVLGNLLDNAIEAAPEGTRVRVTALAGGGELLLRVADGGNGFRGVEDAEDVFRWGWSTKEGGGRGLGLALVRQAVRRHGGTVEVGASPEGGAEFTVRLPLRTRADATAGTEAGAGR